jgi:hypothetical protein
MYFLVIIADLNIKVDTEQLRASVDFLVELCDTVCPVRLLDLLYFFACLPYRCYSEVTLFIKNIFQVGEANLTKWGHQAVEFILGTGCDSAMHFI